MKTVRHDDLDRNAAEAERRLDRSEKVRTFTAIGLWAAAVASVPFVSFWVTMVFFFAALAVCFGGIDIMVRRGGSADGQADGRL